jgi:CBS domain-containing protein
MTTTSITAKEIMAKSLVTLRADMSLTEAIEVLLKSKVSGATVVDEDRHVVGVLSEKDCLRIFAVGAYNTLPHGNVGEYMSKPVTTIAPDTDLFTIAELFMKHSFRRLPVLENGVLVGQVSRRDVLESSRRLWEGELQKKAYPDSKYIPDEIKARLQSK